jgi:DNA topoisomerase IB
MNEVAETLGNTPAVARGSYVDPRVVAGYEQGLTIASAARRADKMNDPAEAQAVLERATRTLINRVAKGSPQSRRAEGSSMPAAA